MMPSPQIVYANPPKWDAAFLDRRMAEHREWQERITAQLASDVISEVAAALEQVEQQRSARARGEAARIARLTGEQS
jgi:hypothetical protein